MAVQFHKLWDPSVFPESDSWGGMGRTSLVLPIFDKYFGPGGRHDVCGFGFEPNQHHVQLLRQTVEHYRAEGQRLTIYEAGGGDFDGLGVVVHDNDKENNEWSTRIIPVTTGEAPPEDAIPLIDIKKWLAANVLARRLPTEPRARPPAIVMKIDAEDSEMLLLSGLLASGGLCKIDFVYVDSLPDDYMASLLQKLAELKCSTVVARIDDEAFHTYRPPWFVDM